MSPGRRQEGTAVGGFTVIAVTTPGQPQLAAHNGRSHFFDGEDDDMNNIISGGCNRPRRAGPAILAAALAGIAVLAAACGGGSPAGAGSGSGQTPYQQALAYARCMRSHGDPGFPDPNSQGLFPHPAGPQYESASRACGHLLPSQPLTAAQKQEHVRQALKFSACMRAHGVPSFPDPIIVQGGTAVGLEPPRSIDRNSPQFQAAVHACREFEPGMAGLMADGGTP
jgi:hypothetical protein